MWLWQMPIEIVFSTKCFQTNFTNVRTFSSMSEDVSNHVNLLLGLFGTKWAPKSINIKLNRIILQNRRKRAMFRIGIFICWQFFFNLIVQNWRMLLLHMPGEWIFPTKTGMAHWALMRFFPSMYQNMPFQISDVFGFHNHITKRTLIFVWIQKHRSKILQFHEKSSVFIGLLHEVSVHDFSNDLCEKMPSDNIHKRVVWPQCEFWYAYSYFLDLCPPLWGCRAGIEKS